MRIPEQPASLPILHDSDLKPYVVFLSPPTLQMYRQQRQKYGEAIKVKRNHTQRVDSKTTRNAIEFLLKEDEYRDSISIAQEMEENYGHYFDSVIPFDSVEYVYEQLLFEINLLEREPQWVPAKWMKDKPKSLNDGIN